MVQWLRITCQCRGHGFDPSPGTCHKLRSNKACVPQLVRPHSRACKLQLLRPAYLEAMLHNKRNHPNERSMHCNKEQLLLTETRKSLHVATETKAQQQRHRQRERKKEECKRNTSTQSSSSSRASLVAQIIKNLPEMQETRFDPWVRKIPVEGNGNPLQYSCLGNPRTEEPGGLQSMGSQRVGHD